VVAAAQAQALAQLIGGGVAEARVTSVAEGNLARLLLNGTSVALTLPTEAEVAPGDRLAVRLSTTAEGQPSIELRRLAPGQAAGPRNFAALNEAQWDKLTEVGTLKIRPITFQSGTSELSHDGKVELDNAAQNLAHYPNFRVVVRGHTGTRGDPASNRELSVERAEAVKRYLMVTHNIDDARLRAVGYGGERPLKQADGESERAYQYRLPRVELYLAS
jgi:outer membrane protein OmpA-like peptidoglycan-associated protein